MIPSASLPTSMNRNARMPADSIDSATRPRTPRLRARPRGRPRKMVAPAMAPRPAVAANVTSRSAGSGPLIREPEVLSHRASHRQEQHGEHGRDHRPPRVGHRGEGDRRDDARGDPRVVADDEVVPEAQEAD